MKSDYLPITSVATIISGGTPKTSIPDYWDGNIPWLSVKDFNNDSKFVYSTEKRITELGLKNSSTNLLKADDIIISARGTVGKLAMIPFDMTFNQSCFGIRADIEKILPHYLYYALKNNIQTIKGSTHGSVFDTITLKDFDIIKINVPNLETQKKIVKILSVLDKKIEFINYENFTIEDMLQNYFNNWIDNIKPIATVGLDEIAKYTNGLAMQKFRPGDNDLGLPVVKIKEMNFGISKDTEKCTSGLKEEYKVFPGDVLFAWSGTLCMKIWDGEVAGLNQHIFKVTSKEYPKWFYYFWTKKHLERFINIAKGKATTMGHIQRKELSLSEVLIPNEHELKKQDELFRPLLEKIVCNNSQRKSLLHLRDTLLPKLMSDKINLGNVNL